MQPVFRATEGNFPRFTALLWERTARASRAAELDAAERRAVRIASRRSCSRCSTRSAHWWSTAPRSTPTAHEPSLSASPELCAMLVGVLGQKMSLRIARQWQSSERLLAALDPAIDDDEGAADRALMHAFYGGELLGTLSLLASENALKPEEAMQRAVDAGLPEGLVASIWQRLQGS